MSEKGVIEFDDQEGLVEAKFREDRYRFLESACWFLVALSISARPIAIFFATPGAVIKNLGAFAEFEQVFFATSLLVLFFPIVFRLIFGSLPLESLRRRTAQKSREVDEALGRAAGSKERTNKERAQLRLLSDVMNSSELARSDPARLFAYYAFSSRKLSQSIYSRAGVYLLVGVGVAFSGLMFFYLLTSHSFTTKPADVVEWLGLVAPRFGILLFIELIAFFFLRQYRSAMDEFRYYEAIKRNREETLVLIRMAIDSEGPIDIMNIVKSNAFFSKAGILAKDEKSEIIESRKLEKSELDILEKVIETISKSKT